LRKGGGCLQERIKELEKENPELKAGLELERKRVYEVHSLFALGDGCLVLSMKVTGAYTERENALQSKRKELRAKEDEFIRYKKDLERQMAQIKREAESQRNQSKPVAVDNELENLRVSYLPIFDL